MSTDMFEDTLRDLLRDTADAAGPGYVEPDAAQVIGLGRRVVRRRRYATGLAAASVLAVAGIGVGVATWGTGSARTSPPAGTSSAAPSIPGLVTADLTRAPSVGQTPPPDERPTVRVGVDLAQRKLTSSLIGPDGGLSDTRHTVLPDNARSATWLSPAAPDGVDRGVLPAAATNVLFLWAGDPGAGLHDLEPLPGTPYQAFATWLVGDGSLDAPLTGLIWTDGESVFDTQGVEVPSVRSENALGYVDSVQGVMGIFDGGVGTGPLQEPVGGSVPSLMFAKEVVGSEEWDATVLLVLPPEARTVKVKASPGTTVKSTVSDSGRPSTDDTLVLVRLTMLPRASGTGLDSVTWTNADGSPGAGVLSE